MLYMYSKTETQEKDQLDAIEILSIFLKRKFGFKFISHKNKLRWTDRNYNNEEKKNCEWFKNNTNKSSEGVICKIGHLLTWKRNIDLGFFFENRDFFSAFPHSFVRLFISTFLKLCRLSSIAVGVSASPGSIFSCLSVNAPRHNFGPRKAWSPAVIFLARSGRIHHVEHVLSSGLTLCQN